MIRFKTFINEIKKPTGNLKKACWSGYTAVGTKEKNGRTVPNCVPEEFIPESDTSHATKAESDLVDHLKKHGAMHQDSKAAGNTGGNDFHIVHPKSKKQVEGTEVHKLEGETKINTKGAKLGSVALRYHEDKGGWHIPDETKKKKPHFAHAVENSTVNGKKLLDHLNDHWGAPKEGKHLPGVTTDETDAHPAHAYMRDKNVHVLHIGDKGTYRAGDSERKDVHNTSLPSFQGKGKLHVSTERKGGGQNKNGTGMQINFRVKPNSVEKSHTDISTDHGIKKVLSSMSKSK